MKDEVQTFVVSLPRRHPSRPSRVLTNKTHIPLNFQPKHNTSKALNRFGTRQTRTTIRYMRFHTLILKALLSYIERSFRRFRFYKCPKMCDKICASVSDRHLFIYLIRLSDRQCAHCMSWFIAPRSSIMESILVLLTSIYTCLIN